MSVLKAGDGGRRGEEHAAQANKRIKGRGPAPRPDAFSAPVFLLPGGCWLPPGTDAAKCPDGRRVAGGRRPTRGALAARGEASTFVFCCGTGRRPLQRSESYGRRRRTHLTPPCFKPTPRRIPLLEYFADARENGSVDGCDLLRRLAAAALLLLLALHPTARRLQSTSFLSLAAPINP